MSHTEIGPQCVGVYLAYPTSETLKPIYRKLKTLVNSSHTKVGITTQSFAAREREYQRTFNREVVFVRLAEVPAERLVEIEGAILSALQSRFSRVGRAREWFDTTDRESIRAEVSAVIARLALPPGARQPSV